MKNKVEWDNLEEAEPMSNDVDWNSLEEADTHTKQKPIETTSAIGAFLRSAGRSPHELLTHLGVPSSALSPLPEFLKEKPYDIQHPFAEFAGSLAFGGPFLKGAKLLPKVIKGFERTRNLSKIGSLREEAQNAEQNAMQAEKVQKDFSNQLMSQYGKSKIPSIQRAMQQALEKQQQIQNQYPGRSNLAYEPPTNLSNRLPGATGEHLLPEAQQATNMIEREMQQYLGAGQPNDVLHQNIMNDLINAGRRQIGRGYNAQKQLFDRQNVRIPKAEEMARITDELNGAIKNGGWNTSEVKNLAAQLERINRGQDISAGDLLSEFKTADKLSKNAYKKAYERNASLTEEQRNAQISQAEQFRQTADRIASLLEEQVDPQFQNTLRDLNRGWRRYASLYKNPYAREIEAQRGISGTNILQKMRGGDIGQQLLRELMQSHPEASRTAIGRTYAGNPRAMLDAPQYEAEFINQNPNLRGMVERLRASLENEQVAARQAARRQEEAQRVQRAYQEDVKLEQDKASARAYAQQAEEYERLIPELEKLAKNKEASIQEKLAASLKLQQAQKDLNRIKKVAKGLGYLLLLAGVDTATRKAVNKLTR